MCKAPLRFSKFTPMKLSFIEGVICSNEEIPEYQSMAGDMHYYECELIYGEYT
jgi:hypothetical protein